MRKVIVLSALLLITGMSVYAQEDYSKSLKTTTTIVENADKYKVETNRYTERQSLYRKSVRCFTMAGRTEIRLYEYSWRRAVQCLESALWL